jgi:hypothetical protein
VKRGPKLGDWVIFQVPSGYLGAAYLPIGELVRGRVTSFGAGTVQVHIPECGSAIVDESIVRADERLADLEMEGLFYE